MLGIESRLGLGGVFPQPTHSVIGTYPMHAWHVTGGFDEDAQGSIPLVLSSYRCVTNHITSLTSISLDSRRYSVMGTPPHIDHVVQQPRSPSRTFQTQHVVGECPKVNKGQRSNAAIYHTPTSA